MSSSELPLLSVQGLTAAWEGTTAVRDLSFSIGAREFVVLMGPNGAGKSTLLRCITGLERPIAGSIYLDGRPITDLPTHRRGIGLLFQDPALFARRSVWENIAYGLQIAHRPANEIDATVASVAQLLHLDSLLDRFPDRLSGGERQRVALGRTVAAQPRLVLLDEPFASIDVELKAELRSEFRRVLATLGIAAIHVTHDREEGLFLGDRVLILYRGELKQSGTPDEVFQHPRDAEVARFLGYNVWPSEGQWLAVDPRDIILGARDRRSIRAQVEAVGFVGDGRLVELRTESGARIEARPANGLPPPPLGAWMDVGWRRGVILAG